MSDIITKQALKESLDDFALQIFRYIDKQSKKTEQNFAEVNQRFDRIEGLLDSYAKDVETYHQEMLMRDHQIDRLRGWIETIAQKTGVKLEY